MQPRTFVFLVGLVILVAAYFLNYDATASDAQKMVSYVGFFLGPLVMLGSAVRSKG